MTIAYSENLLLQSKAEKEYLDILDLVDSLTPLWMKQLDSIAPDFSELLQSLQAIIIVSKSFYHKLTNTITENDLDDLLLHLLKDMEKPYNRYSESFIQHIDQRQDILNAPVIQQFLNDVNSNRQQKITLETLFYAPLYQLNIYKSLFNNYLCIGQQTLSKANQLFDTLMIKNSLADLQMDSFHKQVDCSNVVDVLTDTSISNFQLQQLPKVLLCDTFNCSELSKRIRLILTTDTLVFCSVMDDTDKGTKYSLMYKPISTKNISIRTIHTDRELIGEYNVQFWIEKQKILTMKAASKEDRNMWLGLDINSHSKDQSLLSWAPLTHVVAKYNIRRQSTKHMSTPKAIRTQDIFSFYTDQAGEISPLVSSSDESEDDDEVSWEEEDKSANNSTKKAMLPPVHQSDKSSVLDSGPSSSSTLKCNSISLEKSLPLPPQIQDSTQQMSIVPPVPPKELNIRSPIISGTQSLPARNASLQRTPIPSNMLASDATTPNTNPSLNRPPNVRSLSAHQSVNGRPVSYHQQQNRPPLPPHDSAPQLQQPPLPLHSSYSQPQSPIPHHNSPYMQQNHHQLPVISTEPTSKKPSFMRSVMAAVSSPRSSFRNSKLSTKASDDNMSIHRENIPTSAPFRGIAKNVSQSAVSLDQQSHRPTDHSAPLRRHSAANLSEPQLSPQHLSIPPPQSPFGPRTSTINNHSTPSFVSSVNSSSQSSLALTPPLSRASSPGSASPGVMNRYTSSESGSPPESPEIITHGNTIKNVLYSNEDIKVFHWKDESWYAAEESCLLEVRQTFSNRSCIAIHMKNTGQLYLNAWVLPDTFISRITETDLSLSLHINSNQSDLENYLFHCTSKEEADRLGQVLESMHQESIKMNMVISATSTLRGAPPVLMRGSSLTADNTLSQEELAKTFKLAMQCKCKLFVQSASSKWNSFGSVYMKVSNQYTTKKMHIAMESHKGGKTTQLVSAMVQSRNVERLGPKRLSFLMVDELERNSVVYMVQVREELTCDKIYEYVKTKNAENGW